MAKKLTDLLTILPSAQYDLFDVEEVKFTGLCLDSRLLKSGDVFFALQGLQYDATEFVAVAVENGAIAICCDRKDSQQVKSVLPDRYPLLVVEDLLLNLSQIAHHFYDKPSDKMQVVAITGTDGKTSVSHFIAQMFDHAAVIGTMGNGYLDQLNIASHTTPNAIELPFLMSQFYQSGCQFISMEASSHGLSQGRLSAINVDTAVLTNFSRDHLDYHGSLDAYKQAKKILFTGFNLKNIVVNYNDELGKEIYQESIVKDDCQIIAYALNNTDNNASVLNAQIIKVLSTGFEITISFKEHKKTVLLPILGKFNIENAMATLAVMLATGMGFNQACEKLRTLQAVKGRMQHINIEKPFTIVIDYAHTPQALSSAIAAVKMHSAGKVICVFGCGGDRDKGKRPLMAQAASHAHYVVVTNDNPRTENPVDIVENICKGFDFDQYEVEYDRAKAIHIAIDRASSEDIVLIAGKGHEDYQIIGQEKTFFSDEYVVREYLGEAA